MVLSTEKPTHQLSINYCLLSQVLDLVNLGSYLSRVIDPLENPRKAMALIPNKYTHAVKHTDGPIHAPQVKKPYHRSK